MKISMQKLAEKVGVSKMTISLYLRDPQTKRISEAMKEKMTWVTGSRIIIT